MNYKVLTYEDYDDILDISKNIWEGKDYIPKIFHKWVDAKEGCFLGLEKDNKIVAFWKYTILPDRQGWIEGLRVQIEYRGQQLAHAIIDMLFNIAREDLRNGKTTNIGICTQKDTKASIKCLKLKTLNLFKVVLYVLKVMRVLKS